MSSVFISNFVTNDVLQEAKLKPWYETVRGYLVFANVLISAYMVYDVKSDNLLNCVSANESVEFSEFTVAYVNAYCTAQLLKWHQRNFGLVCLLCSVAIYLSFGWWLLIPSVKKSFLLVRQCDDELRKLERGPAYLKSILKRHYLDQLEGEESSTEETSKLIINTHRLWYEHSGDFSIFTIYRLRNAISFGICVGVVVLLNHLVTNENANALDCQSDVLNGARAHCFVLGTSNVSCFFITICVVASILCIFALVLLVGFDGRIWRNYGKRQLQTQKKDWTNAWTIAFLDAVDLKSLQHGEDCNRFAELFSRSADPISTNTRILMYIYSVLEPNDIESCVNQLSSLSPEARVLTERMELGITESQNSDTLEKLKQLHDHVKSGKYFDKFLTIHRKTFSNEHKDLNQRVDDTVACDCKELLASEIKLDKNGCSLMWHAFRNLKSANKIYLAAHLVLAGMDEAGNPLPGSIVARRNVMGKHSKDHINNAKSDSLRLVMKIAEKFTPDDFWRNGEAQQMDGDDDVETPLNPRI